MQTTPTAKLIDSLGGSAKVSRFLSSPRYSVPLKTVSAWKRRNFIPDEYRPHIVQMATLTGVANVSYESLTLMCRRRKLPLPRLSLAE